MLACKQCLENYWSFTKINNFIRAECKSCGNIVEFEARKNFKKQQDDSETCKKCGGVVKKIVCKFRQNKLKKAYYYEAYYKCKFCRTIFMNDKHKIINKK